MPIDLTFDANPIEERSPGLGRAFEQAVRQELQQEAGARGPLRVRFAVWDDEALGYVCKVEGTSAPSMERALPAWRWWSGLVRTPAELAEQLHEALAARRAAPHAADASASQDRWGWAELQLR